MAFRFPNNTERTAVVGMTGSGKTQAGAWILANMVSTRNRWIILDFKRDELLNNIHGVEEIGFNTVPKQPGLYIAHPFPDDDGAVDELLWKVWERENTGVFVDEGYMLNNSKAFRALLTQGRSKKIPMIILSQRPAWITRFVWSEANFHQVFQLSELADKKRVREFVPGYDPMLDVPQYHSYWHDVVGRKLYIADPAPASEIILDKFSERLGKRFIYV